MDDDVNVVVGGAEQVVRLDDLEPLVHHGGRVHGDLGAHRPVRVLQCVGHLHLAEDSEMTASDKAQNTTNKSQNNKTQI